MKTTSYTYGDKAQESRIAELIQKINQSSNIKEVERYITEIRMIEAEIARNEGEKIGYRNGRRSVLTFA